MAGYVAAIAGDLKLCVQVRDTATWLASKVCGLRPSTVSGS